MNFATRSRCSGSRLVPLALIGAMLIVAILPALAAPAIVQVVSVEREKELLRALREIRQAIANYKAASDARRIKVELNTEGYPIGLEVLVEGVNELGPDGKATGAKLKFLQRIPIDPITKGYNWGLNSSFDKPGSAGWGGQNVAYVYCASDAVGSDGRSYSEW